MKGREDRMEKHIDKYNNQKSQTKHKTLLKVIILVLLLPIVLLGVTAVFADDLYWITTAKWTDWDEENTTNVTTAMGEENTETRFRLYFQYYNVLHELGHGLIRYNHGVNIPVADEEQLVNDFAVAYWNYYGDPDNMEELYDIVTYAVENVGDNFENGIDYLENARANSNQNSFNNDFFNFNDYGWFQFSCVKHSIEQNKSLEEVLKEMGFTDFSLTEQTRLEHNIINEEESTIIINEAVEKFNEWGLYFPKTRQNFSEDPNMNMSRPFISWLEFIIH